MHAQWFLGLIVVLFVAAYAYIRGPTVYIPEETKKKARRFTRSYKPRKPTVILCLKHATETLQSGRVALIDADRCQICDKVSKVS